jgi:hypothetical protein
MITADGAQRALPDVLLDAPPSMLTVADCHRRMPDGADADYALHQLMTDGLATQLGDLVGASRTAVRAKQLGL